MSLARAEPGSAARSPKSPLGVGRLARLVLTLLLLLSPSSILADDPGLSAHDYLLHCAGCHRMDGSGSEAVPSLASLGPLVRTEGGRDYLMRVPGVAQAPLSDERLARLLDYVVRTFSELDSFPAFSSQELGLARNRPLRDPQAARPIAAE